MVKSIRLEGAGSVFVAEFSASDYFDCFIECDNKRIRLGGGDLNVLIKRFLAALTLSKEKIQKLYSDEKNKQDDPIIIIMFGSAAMATIEYEHNGVVIQWEDGWRKVLGITKLDELNKQKWIQEFEKLKEVADSIKSARAK